MYHHGIKLFSKIQRDRRAIAKKAHILRRECAHLNQTLQTLIAIQLRKTLKELGFGD